MRFDVVTLFPELFTPFLTTGITRRAFESGQVEVKLSNPRDFAEGNYRRVDDRPFGGGPGMVMMAEPLSQCVNRLLQDRGGHAPGGAGFVLDGLDRPHEVAQRVGVAAELGADFG